MTRCYGHCCFHTGTNSRICSLANLIDPPRRTYPAELLPDDGTWGKYVSPINDRSRALCLNGSNHPYVVRLVGRVNTATFMENGKPAAKVILSVVPWTDGTTKRVRDILGSLTEPPISG